MADRNHRGLWSEIRKSCVSENELNSPACVDETDMPQKKDLH